MRYNKIMKHIGMRLVAVTLLILIAGGKLCAQRGLAPAWTRQLSPELWAKIDLLSSTQVAKKQLYVLPLERQLPAVLNIKTTPDNLIKHKTFYSGLFSRQEKEVLLKSFYPKATLGKLAYMHDKHAIYFEKMSVWDAQHVNQTAFAKHQEILRDLLGTLQSHYLEEEPDSFTSEIFSKEEISRLNEAPSQPAAYMLSVKQLRDFAALPSLQEQKFWVQRQIAWEEEMAHALLLQNIASLSATQFEQYYRSQMRIRYFKLLEKVLARTTNKRPSAIVRYKRSLPGQQTLMTDAQRGGYLQFMKDTHSQPVSDQIEQFNSHYGPYATAEALDARYEIALQYGMNSPELFGMEEGARLRNLAPYACLEELTPKIQELENKLAALRINPSDTPEFYKAYYQLHAQKRIYQTLTARAQVILHHLHD